LCNGLDADDCSPTGRGRHVDEDEGLIGEGVQPGRLMILVPAAVRAYHVTRFKGADHTSFVAQGSVRQISGLDMGVREWSLLIIAAISAASGTRIWERLLRQVPRLGRC